MFQAWGDETWYSKSHTIFCHGTCPTLPPNRRFPTIWAPRDARMAGIDDLAVDGTVGTLLHLPAVFALIKKGKTQQHSIHIYGGILKWIHNIIKHNIMYQWMGLREVFETGNIRFLLSNIQYRAGFPVNFRNISVKRKTWGFQNTVGSKRDSP